MRGDPLEQSPCLSLLTRSRDLNSGSSSVLLLFFADLDPLLSGIISCDGFTKYSGSFSEDYCWTQGLYTIKEAYDLLTMNVPYPGRVPGKLM